MVNSLPTGDRGESQVTVRYWASARAAAGVESEHVAAGTLADVIGEIVQRHRKSADFAARISTCAVLLDEVPVGSRDPSTVSVRPGAQLEFLPPFAGGA